MQIPTPKTWIDHQTVTPQDMNEQVRDPSNFLLSRPCAIVGASATATSLPNGAWTPVNPWDTLIFDNDGIAGTRNSGYLTIVTPGLYQVSAQATITGSQSGRRLIGISKVWNDPYNILVRMEGLASTIGNFEGNVSGLVRLAAGDTVGVLLYHSSGSTLNTSIAHYGEDSRLSVLWVAP